MPDDDALPPYRVASDRRSGREIIPWSPAGAGRSAEEAAAAGTARARRVLVACAVAVAAGVTGVMALIYPSGDATPPVQELPGAFVFPDLPEPSAAVSMLPAPPTTSPPAADPPPVQEPVTHRSSARTSKPAPSRATTSPAPATALVVGSTVSLEVVSMPGYRLRHQDFTGRVDRISDAQDRADSRFVVRKGLGKPSCVSLEAVNYPGYFLRHQYFVLRLEAPGLRENPNVYAADATFCPQPGGDGTSFVLESINYPDMGLAVGRDNVVYLMKNGQTAFRTRPPL